MGVGTGKTLTAIRAATPLPPPYLVICRRDDFVTWRKELLQEGYAPHEILTIDKGTGELPCPQAHCPICARTGIDLEGNQCPGCSPFIWVLCTWDLPKNEDVLYYLTSIPFTIVIGDELHYIQNPKFRNKGNLTRSGAVISATRHIPNRLGLTATPIGNDLMDIWSQAYFIDDGTLFGKNPWSFRQRYFVPGNPGWYPRRGAPKQIATALKFMAFSVDPDEVLDLPPVVRITKGFTLTGMQRRQYIKCLDEWALQLKRLGPDEIDIDLTIVQLTKLRQICSGFVYPPPPKHDPHPEVPIPPVWLRSNKLRSLTSLITKDGPLAPLPKLVIWCAFTAEIYKIAELLETLSLSFVTFTGNMSPKLKQAARERFASQPDPSVFVAQVDAGVGMNELTIANTAIYFSNSLRARSRTQSEGRTRRIGSEIHSHIYYYDLIAENTLEEKYLTKTNDLILTASKIQQSLRAGASPKELF